MVVSAPRAGRRRGARADHGHAGHGHDPRPARVAGAAGRVFAWLREVDATFSTYRRDSEISRIGRGELAVRDAQPMVREVLARCEALRRGDAAATSTRGRPARLDPSGPRQGLGGRAGGGAARGAGARDFCIDAGGDLALRGGPWRVGIRHPLERRRLAAVADRARPRRRDLRRATSAARTSSTRTPARRRRGVLSVTVVGPDLATADAYATAAFAMGERGPAWTAACAATRR